MSETRWLIVNRKTIMPLLAAVAVILALFLFKNFYVQEIKVAPEKLVSMALEKTKASKSYRFNFISVLTVGKKKDYYSKVAGEWTAPDKTHIKGKILGTQMELYQIGAETFLLDQFSKRWLVLKGNQLAQAELFASEVNPLGHLNFKEIPDVRYAGVEKIKGEKMMVLECRPNLEHPFLEMLFTDFAYRLWIDDKNSYLKKAVMKAKSKHHPQSGIEVTIEFFDFNKPIQINPPK